MPDTLECLEQGFKRAETEMDFMLLIKELPEEQREIIYLRFAHDLTLREIGQILNLPQRTVQSRLRAALKRMKKELGKGGILHEEI